MVKSKQFGKSAVIVKPSKETKQTSIFLITICIFSPIVLFIAYIVPTGVLSAEEVVKNAVVITAVWYLIVSPTIFVKFALINHYLVFDEGGITLCCFNYKKFRPWSDFEVKQIINKRNSEMHMLWEGVIFASTLDEYKRFLTSPLRRRCFSHNRLLFVTFELNLKWYARPNSGPIYEVNKEWFVSELEKLGVALNESHNLIYK